MPSPYSYSSLTKFEACPQQYAHKYVWKTKVPEEELALDLPMSTGSVVHSVLEWAHKEAMDNKTISMTHALERVPELWEQVLKESPHPISPEELAPFLERAKQNVEWYFSTLFQPETEATIGIEKKMMYPLDAGRKQWLIGFLDRISQPSETKLIIHDYKTGKSTMSANALSKDFQAMLYGAMVAHRYQPLSQIELQWHYLSLQKTVKANIDPENVRASVQKAQRLANGIESHKQAGLFPARVGWQCSRCDFASVCPAQKEKMAFKS